MTYTSDRRIKKNFSPAEDGYFERFMQLEIQWWNYKNDAEDDRRNFGPIAQDVERLFPNRVVPAPDQIEGQEGFYPLLLDGSGLFGPDLAQAFIELGRRHLTLQASHDDLTARIEALEAAQ